jgi:predicted RNA-binding Zn ribbon-like protein
MYDFDAGDISLDFANTNNWHASAAPQDYLHNYADLVEWGVKARLISVEVANQLNQIAEEHPDETANNYEQAIQVREAIYRIFSSQYADKPIPEADLALLNSIACQAMSHLQLIRRGRKVHWQFPANFEGANFILWPVARAAADLLTSDRVSRVRECEDDRGCGYLFIDQTKNHSRRWCSMESCGNRAKARRHYSRLQTA